MTLEENFADAQVRVKSLPKTPDSTTLLQLYSLFKQASSGDVQGKRPGMLDIKGRAKYDAWVGRKGVTKAAAMEQYVTLVARLLP